MEVTVEGCSISQEEVDTSKGWKEVRHRRSDRRTSQHRESTLSPTRLDKRNNNPWKGRLEQIRKASRMPHLPRGDYKIVIRPRGGLKISEHGIVPLTVAVQDAAGIPRDEREEDIVCPNNYQNILIVSTSDQERANKYQEVARIKIQDTFYEANAYETAPDMTAKGVIRGIPLDEGPRDITAAVVTSAGIFITPGIVYEDSGSVGVDLIVWVAAGVASLIHCLCFAELGTMLPSAGGVHEYLRAGMDSTGRIGDFLSFLAAWCFFLVDPIAVSIQGLTFTAYALSLPYGNCTPPHAVTVLVTIVIVELAAVVNTFSLKTSMKIQNLLFLVKLGVLLAIIATGTVWCLKGVTESNKETGDTLSKGDSSMITCMAEEMSNPSRIIPRSLLGGVFLVTALQLLTNGAYFVVLNHESFAASEATAVTFGRAAWGQAGEWLVPIAVCVSTFGTMSASSFSNSRLIMAAARSRHLPAPFGLITLHSSLPVIAIAFRTCLAVVITVFGSVGLLAKCAMVIVSTINVLVMFALLRLREAMKGRVRAVKVPTFLVLVNIAIELSMALTPFNEDSHRELLGPRREAKDDRYDFT
ncbi:b(0,+)-type amino acid transporter 1-like [Dermacentor andersoni]|uniref:b(0,+)-type amino acid transporter 1-like n=1 Tax=Dermacentor andersoni TaxID=34620 RepID=UPI0024173945|nr:b(0,+)-type amino acid transporter 1-like [Dermacentor andersoni]